MTDRSNGILKELPQRLHHNAYVCEDQERTRQFYEDVIGLPLLATWIEEPEFAHVPGKRLTYSHTFYGIGDGVLHNLNVEVSSPDELTAAYRMSVLP
mgnify:CR=1 FL=1